MVAKLKPDRKRRGRGEGSVFQRASGIWVATVDLPKASPIDGDGAAKQKRQRRTIYGRTKAQVLEQMRKLQSGSPAARVQSKATTLGEFLDSWLADVAKPAIRATTLDNYERVIKLHIKPRIGGVQLQKLTAGHVEWLYSRMADDGVGPNTRKLAHAVLRSALTYALRRKLVGERATDAVSRRRFPGGRLNRWTRSRWRSCLTPPRATGWKPCITWQSAAECGWARCLVCAGRMLT